MPAQRRVSNMYYEDGSTARKLLPKEEPKKRKKVVKNNALRQENIKKHQRQVAKKRASMVAFILCGFAMSMIITYRYNVINEKNLEIQNLETQIESLSSELATSQIEVDQNTDLDSIEAYAKQQLGMTKASSSQTVYVDTSQSTDTIVINQVSSFWNKIVSYIKQIFS